MEEIEGRTTSRLMPSGDLSKGTSELRAKDLLEAPTELENPITIISWMSFFERSNRRFTSMKDWEGLSAEKDKFLGLWGKICGATKLEKLITIEECTK